MVDVIRTSSQLSSFLRLTDYVDSEKLVHLSADDLQGIVCGSDGHYLEHISKISGARIQFVSNPIPGFQILAVDQKSFRSGCAEGLRIVHAIRSAAIKAASQVENKTETPTQFVSDGLLPTPVVKTRRTRYSSDSSYHPLYSDASPVPVYYPVMVLVPGALLPTPVPSLDETAELSVIPMSPELCMQIIKSPYLSSTRRRKTVDGGIENLKKHAKSRIAPVSPELAPLDTPNSIPDDQLLPNKSTFDDEIADCLPGMPGARQSKEYKKLRRKISEIDDLVGSNVDLDYCQRIKVERRPKYLEMIRAILKGEVAESSEDEVPETNSVENDSVPPESVTEDLGQYSKTESEEKEEKVTVASTPVEPITPSELILPVSRKKQNQKKHNNSAAHRKVASKVQPKIIEKEPNTPAAIVHSNSLFLNIYEFFCMLISWILRVFQIHHSYL